MWNDIAAGLALFESAAIFSIVGILLFATANLVLVRFGKWKPPAFYAYGLFGGLKGAPLAALAFILLRSLFFISCAFSSATLQPAHVWYGLLLTLGILVLLRDIRLIPFDLLYVAAVYGALYGESKIRENSASLPGKFGTAMLVVAGALAILLSVFLCLRGVESLTRHARSYTAVRGKRILPQLALPVTAGLSMVLLIMLLGQTGTLIVHDSIFQNNGGKIVTYSGANMIKRTSNTCTLQPVGGKLQKLLTGPLYFDKLDEILTTEDVIIVQPKLSRVNRLPSMSRISKANGSFTVETDNGKSTVSDFFLFDGKNSFVFFEPVTLQWGSQSFTASSFSCINVQYGSSLAVFDRDKKSLTKLNNGTDDVTVTMQCQAKINLSSDILNGMGGQEQMLFIQPNLLQDFK